MLRARAFEAARSVGVYVTCARLREPETRALLEAALARGKRCYVPLVDDRGGNMRLLHVGARARALAVGHELLPACLLLPAAAAATARLGLPASLSQPPTFLQTKPNGNVQSKSNQTDSLDEMKPAPPFGILEPPSTYADGAPRESGAGSGWRGGGGKRLPLGGREGAGGRQQREGAD